MTQQFRRLQAEKEQLHAELREIIGKFNLSMDPEMDAEYKAMAASNRAKIAQIQRKQDAIMRDYHSNLMQVRLQAALR